MAESLKETCQFCAEVFQNKDELQLHQVSDCGPIEAANKFSCGQTNNGTTANETLQNKQIHETLVIDLQESAETLHETAIQVSPQQPNNTQKQSDDTLVIEVQESAETLCETTIQTYIQNNYTLNKSNALQKKRKCCDKPTYTVQERPNCTVVTLNTASFEFFREVLVTYLESNLDVYTVSHTPQTDQMNNVTQDILCITNNTTSAPM